MKLFGSKTVPHMGSGGRKGPVTESVVCIWYETCPVERVLVATILNLLDTGSQV